MQGAENMVLVAPFSHRFADTFYTLSQGFVPGTVCKVIGEDSSRKLIGSRVYISVFGECISGSFLILMSVYTDFDSSR